MCCVLFVQVGCVGKDEQNQRVNCIYKLEVGGYEQRMLPNNNTRWICSGEFFGRKERLIWLKKQSP